MKFNLTEAKGRLRPAIIHMKRGTVIPVDHARWLTQRVNVTPNDESGEFGIRRGMQTGRQRTFYAGNQILAVGIGPGLFETTHGSLYPSSKAHSILKEARDFYAMPTRVRAYVNEYDEYICGHCDLPYNDNPPCCDEPMLDANTLFVSRRKFNKILTMYPENIADIQWLR